MFKYDKKLLAIWIIVLILIIFVSLFIISEWKNNKAEEEKLLLKDENSQIKNEILKLEADKNSMSGKISDYENQINNFTKKESDLNTKISELENFKPYDKDKSVKELIEEKEQVEKEAEEKRKLEEQARIEKENSCLFKTSVCYKEYYASINSDEVAKDLCSNKWLKLVSLDLMLKDFDKFNVYLKETKQYWSIMKTNTEKLWWEIKSGYLWAKYIENWKVMYGSELSLAEERSKYWAYIYTGKSIQWYSIYNENNIWELSVLCYRDIN